MGDANLTDRLRGKYPVGPIGKDGKPEFGCRQFTDLPPIQNEAADAIEALQQQLAERDAELAALKAAWAAMKAELDAQIEPVFMEEPYHSSVTRIDALTKDQTDAG